MHLLVGDLPCPCLKCVSGLRRLKKTWTFLRCIHVFDPVLKYCSEIYERNWLKLLLYFNVLMGIVASVIGRSFLVYVSGFRLKFSRIAVTRKRLQLEYKTDLNRTAFFWSFSLGYAAFRRFHICIDWSLHELLSCYSSLTTLKFFDS